MRFLIAFELNLDFKVRNFRIKLFKTDYNRSESDLLFQFHDFVCCCHI